MIQQIAEKIKLNSLTYKFIIVLFGVFTFWWITMYGRGLTEGFENDLFTVLYCILALLGGIAGWRFAQKWGGMKSVLGKAIYMFTFGLLAQFVGQVMYNYNIFALHIEVPYPSWGDAVFFASVIFYIIGAALLSKVSGIKFSFKSVRGKVQAVLIPLGILLVSYFFYLKGYQPDLSMDLNNIIILFLDFGFPIGQAIYVSIAILGLLISKDILGGMMRKPILLLIFALIVQYFADFSFSYQVSRETWYVGGINDYLYCLAYFLMAISLFSIGNMFYKVQDS